MKDLFKKLLDDLSSKDLLSEEKVEELESLFEDKLKDYKEQIYNEALDAIDIEHGKKLDEVLAKIDEDHSELLDKVIAKMDEEACEGLKKVMEHLDEKHTAGLQAVIDKYEKEIKEELEQKVGDFLDVYMEDALPEDKIVDKIRLEKLEEMVAQIKKAVVISEISMDEEIKEAVLDAKQIIESKDEEINQLMVEKIELTKKLKRNEATKLLEDKVKDVTPKLRAYLETRFKDSDATEIEEQFEEAVKAFEEDEQLIREDLKNNTSPTVNPKPITEGGAANGKPAVSPIMESYIQRYKNSNKRNH